MHSSPYLILSFVLGFGLLVGSKAEKTEAPGKQSEADGESHMAGKTVLEVATSEAAADVSKEFAAKARRVWVAFECAALADIAGEKNKAETFFTYGLREGRAFLEAAEANKIKKEDLNSQAPVGVLMLLQGPSHDFILGRIYSFAEKNALKEINDGEFRTDKQKAVYARYQLDLKNSDMLLDLISKGK
jgi:hypothetical protein